MNEDPAEGFPADPDSELEAKVASARKTLATAITVGNLTGDPVSKALEALSITLGAQLALHKASTGHLQDVSDQFDAQVSESLARAGSAMAAHEAAVVSKLAPQLAAATDQSVRARLWTVKFRTIAARAAGAVVLAVVAMGGGYTMGFASGRASGLYTADSLAAGVSRDGPAAAAMWAQLVSDNDIRSAMAACQKTIAQQGGRRACSLPVWLNPASPPAAVQKP